MKKHKRCPLTVKFGKDIASLIWNMIWQHAMKLVCHEYHSFFRFQHEILIAGSPYYITVNGRSQSTMFGYENHKWVYNIKTRLKVADIPKNYWSIKELY
jgi:hypothetical protein